jgi:putative endonuclease
MHTVYIIYSDAFDVFYKGYTTQIHLRIQQHNNNESQYTTNKGPWRLVYSKAYELKSDALIEEKRIKRLNRKAIEKLIGSSAG